RQGRGETVAGGGRPRRRLRSRVICSDQQEPQVAGRKQATDPEDKVVQVPAPNGQVAKGSRIGADGVCDRPSAAESQEEGDRSDEHALPPGRTFELGAVDATEREPAALGPLSHAESRRGNSFDQHDSLSKILSACLSRPLIAIGFMSRTRCHRLILAPGVLTYRVPK